MSAFRHPVDMECPFCAIAAAYPYRSSSLPPSTSPRTSRSPPSSPTSRTARKRYDLRDCVPSEPFVGQDGESKANESDPSIPRLQAAAFPVLASPEVLAFLDIMPMTRGHLLVTVRGHRPKVGNMQSFEASEMGFWLPIMARVLSKVTGCTDYNIVQNNGVRAAQVVPHVHFHVIPRNTDLRDIKAQSWTMFGKGQRDDLDDEEGAKMAFEIREELRRELAQVEREEVEEEDRTTRTQGSDSIQSNVEKSKL